MKLRPDNIQIKQENPFEKDLLKREQYANVLSQIVKNSEGGFTLSVNAEWGYGKTTFVKMWEAALQKDGYKTIYFNAWESDFIADPMMALIDGIIEELGQTLNIDNAKFFSALSDSLIQLGKLVPGISTYAHIADAIKSGVDKLSQKDFQLEECRGVKKTVGDFRSKLSECASAVGDGKQLIIFVDELDRCRPDYAVQMLERIKHFFEVENIIFVLSVDKEVICKSIKAVYGGLEIDTEAYLRRFIDLEYDLPEPSVSDFIDVQFEQKGLAAYFTNYEDHIHRSFNGEDRNVTLRIALSDCLRVHSKSLRDIEKYFNRLAVIFSSKELSHTTCDITSYLLYLFMFHRDIYDHLQQGDMDIKEMWSRMENQIKSSAIDERSDSFSRYVGMTIGTFAAYTDLVDRKNGYRHEILNDETKLEWFPKEYINRLRSEKDKGMGEVMLRQCMHIELLKETFSW